LKPIQRRRWRNRWVCPITASLTCVALCIGPATSSSGSTPSRTSGGGLWPTYHGNLSRTGYTTDTSINPQNAGQLQQSWSVSVAAAISAQPIVHSGVVYWGDWKGYLHATTGSGKALWSTSLGTTPKPPGCIYDLARQGILSTPTIGTIGGRQVIWAGGGRGQMVALDASSGKIFWRTDLGNHPGNSIWSSPAYYKGSIYVGVASFQGCPPVFGSVVRLNAATGAIQAVLNFASLVSAKCRELGAWSSPAVDAAENAIFIGTSNDFCNSRYQDAILRLNPSTLRISSLWQVPRSQHPFDSDFGATPMLFSSTIGGVTRQLVGAVNKNGVYYVLNRDDLGAGPVWTFVAAKASALAAQACGNVDAISSSAWGGPGSLVMVAGLTNSRSSCIGTLAALNPSTGQPEWQTRLPGSVEGALTEVPGIVAVGTGPTVELISTANGQVLFSYTEATKPAPTRPVYGAPTGEFWAPPTVSGNALYVANEDGSLRAFSS
jgi:polyvinyl alcohol dehydrogenase (cytochrome)